MDITIEDDASRIPEAARVAGEAFIHDASQHTLEIWKAVDESTRAERYGRIFALTLPLPGRHVMTAVTDNQTVGCLCYYHSRHTKMSLLQRLKILVPFVRASGRSFRQFLKLQALIEQLVPDHDTLHLGPVAVLPQYQGHGVGSRLLRKFVSIADAQQMDAFLQTGKAENVTLYQKYGFQVTNEVTFCDAPVWAMVRSQQK